MRRACGPEEPGTSPRSPQALRFVDRLQSPGVVSVYFPLKLGFGVLNCCTELLVQLDMFPAKETGNICLWIHSLTQTHDLAVVGGI